MDELIERTPADGVIVGVGGSRGGRSVVMAYDYTVLAGTQGLQGHRKQDRLFAVAARSRLPVVLFAEGGGGRPGRPTTSASPGSTAARSRCSPG